MPDFQRKLQGFLKMKPPTFDHANDDPIATEDWLREMVKKRDLTVCTSEECVGVASHQLVGAARSWWDSFCATHGDPLSITWDEFAEAFREFHVPKGVMEAKAEEFHNFTQGHKKVQEYATQFTSMMRYALEVAVDEKKKLYHFKKGLHAKLKVAISGHVYHTPRTMINKCLEMERDRLEADAYYKDEKRRSEGPSRAPAQRQRGGNQ